MISLPSDIHWMKLALEQAYLGLGSTSPNPPVGAVIVADNQLIAADHHPKAGLWHAERRAIAQAHEKGYSLQGATIYVTLEPCSSWGKTPPCTQAIIDAGITRVVYACQDPDLRHRGRADALLRSHGIEVLSGVCEASCGALLRPWAYAIRNQRPWVVAKVATSLDARLSRRTSPWLSSEPSLYYAHELRAQSDAILIGGGTLRMDNPSLTIRKIHKPLSEYKEQPWRIVLTRDEKSLREDAKEAHLFTDQYRERTLVFENIDFGSEDFLRSLFQDYGITQLMIESGGGLLELFLQRQLINEWVQIIAPYIAGGPHHLVSGDEYLGLEAQLSEQTSTPSGQDIILRGILKDQ